MARGRREDACFFELGVPGERVVEGRDGVARGDRVGIRRGREEASEERVEIAMLPFEKRGERGNVHAPSYCEVSRAGDADWTQNERHAHRANRTCFSWPRSWS